MRKLDGIARLMSKDMWRFGPPPGTPSEMIKQSLYVSPFFENDIVGLAQKLGADRVLAGSDYPHPEGLAEPWEFAEELEGFSEKDHRLIMRENFDGLVV